MRRLKKLLVIPLTVCLFITVNLISGIGWKVSFLFDFSSLDKDGTFMNVSVHHIIMMLLSFPLVCILSKILKTDFGIYICKNEKRIISRRASRHKQFYQRRMHISLYDFLYIRRTI